MLRSILRFVFIAAVNSTIFSQTLDTLPSYTLEEITIKSGEVIIPHSVNEINFSLLNELDVSSVAQSAFMLPSIKVQTNSRGETLWNLRGSNERQLILFFDGNNLNIPWDNRIDLGLIPTNALNEIKVIKGVPSVIYGPNSLFGIIKMNSIDPFEIQMNQFKVSAGSNSFTELSGFTSQRSGNFGFLFSAGKTERSNFNLPRNFIDPYNLESERINSGFSKYNIFSKVSYRTNQLKNDLSISYINSKKDVAPEIGVSSPRFWQYPLWEKFTLSNSGSINLYKSYNSALTYFISATNFNLKINQFINEKYDEIEETEFNNDLYFNGRIILTSLLNEISLLKVALNGYSSTHKESFAIEPETKQKYRQNILSLSSEYNLTLSNSTLIAGGSYDISSTPLTGDKPKKENSQAYSLNIAAIYDITNDFYTQINFGRKVRFPALRELYSGALGRFVPNPDLKNETAYISDISFNYNSQNLNTELNVFYNFIEDGIVRKSLPERKFQRINEQSIKSYGSEFAATILLSNLILNFHLTYLNSKSENEIGTYRDTLEYKPEFTGGFNIKYALFKKANASLESYFSANEYSLKEGSEYFQKLPDHILFNFRTAYKFRIHDVISGEVYLRINNIFDKLYFPQFGLPEPGREFIIGIINEF